QQPQRARVAAASAPDQVTNTPRPRRRVVPPTSTPSGPRTLRRRWLIACALFGLLVIAGGGFLLLKDALTFRETPWIGALKVISGSAEPARLTFSLAIDPSMAGVSAEKSECWLCIGDPRQLEALTPLFQRWKREGGGGLNGIGNAREGWWAGH